MGVGFDHCGGGGYMKFNHRPNKGSKSLVLQSHRMVYFLHHGKTPEILDHIDGDRLNNSIGNLRAVTPAQNAMNRRSRPNSSSRYLGVSWNKASEKWSAQIIEEGKKRHLGLFTSEIEAAQSYDKAALVCFGEFANPNFK